jgi:hypothetical protein
MPVSFRIFVIVYSLVIGLFVVSSLLGFAGNYFLIFLGFSLMALGWAGCFFLAKEVVKRHPVAKAMDKEIEREDDVLLQGITFLSTILFFYVNTLIPDANGKVAISLMIVVANGSFYLLRAVAKVKSNPFYRLLSVFFLVWVVSLYCFGLILLLSPTTFPIVLNLPPLIFTLVAVGLTVLSFLLVSLVIVFFAQRYGTFKPRRQGNAASHQSMFE